MEGMETMEHRVWKGRREVQDPEGYPEKLARQVRGVCQEKVV